jgi:hypothetical protein
MMLTPPTQCNAPGAGTSAGKQHLCQRIRDADSLPDAMQQSAEEAQNKHGIVPRIRMLTPLQHNALQRMLQKPAQRHGQLCQRIVTDSSGN